MELQDEGRETQITDKFKELTQTTAELKVSDTPLTIPQAVRPPQDILRTEMALTELLAQKQTLGVSSITTGTNMWQHIRTVAFSHDYMNLHLGDKLSTAARFFTGWRCESIIITVEVTSMYQHQGAAVGFTTNMPSPLYNGTVGKVMNARLPRKFIPFGANSTYTFELGWNSLLKFWPIQSKITDGGDRANSGHNSFMDNGRFILRVFDPLQVAPNVTDLVQFRFWVQVKGLRLGIYSPQNLL